MHPFYLPGLIENLYAPSMLWECSSGRTDFLLYPHYRVQNLYTAVEFNFNNIDLSGTPCNLWHNSEVFWAYHDISTLGCIKALIDHGQCHVSKLLIMDSWSPTMINSFDTWQLLCMKVLIHGKDWYLFHIQDATGKKIRTGNPCRHDRKCNGQPGKYTYLDHKWK